jgi:hypothetical protein
MFRSLNSFWPGKAEAFFQVEKNTSVSTRPPCPKVYYKKKDGKGEGGGGGGYVPSSNQKKNF